jgi:exopolyphosphatase / guanosine-5'-triphosphate,3'-diphosphate pyrophosphatase
MNQSKPLTRWVGIIDLGSNSARLMVAHYRPGYAYRITDEISRRVRLSEGEAADGRLRPEACARAIETVRLFKAFCDAHGIKRVVPVATAAVRDAANRKEFLADLKAATGVRFRVLSGEEEAYYGVLGVVNGVGLREGLVMDLGGGSAEVSRVAAGKFQRGQTTPLGSVRLTEMFFDGVERVNRGDVGRLVQYVRPFFDALGWMDPAHTRGAGRFVGVGGTVRALARIDREQRQYGLGLVNGYELELKRLEALIERLADLPVNERVRRVPGLQADRADIILAGALVVREALRRAGAKSLVVSGHGLREGLFFREFLRPSDQPVLHNLREFSVLNLGRLYNFDAVHAGHVTQLSLSLFDQLVARHGYGQMERDCLWAAGQLHDIGTVVDYYDHHKHSDYIIMSAGLPGYSHRETALIALLCLYHRKGTPTVEQLTILSEPDDLRRVSRLASLLRLAEYLDRSRTQVVSRLRLRYDSGEKIRLWAHVRSGADAQVEIWEAQRNADLFEAAYDCKLEIKAN